MEESVIVYYDTGQPLLTPLLSFLFVEVNRKLKLSLLVNIFQRMLSHVGMDCRGRVTEDDIM
tara:strand:- start:122 stop:307 length:186 start_codon:yes stop_codon:yes gene_type:complete